MVLNLLSVRHLHQQGLESMFSAFALNPDD